MEWLDLFPHGVLGLIDIGVDLWQGAVVSDRTRQNKGDPLFDAAIQDAVVNPLPLYKSGDRAVLPHPVDGVDVVVMATRPGFLGVDILAQGGAQVGGFQVVGCQGIAR